jgi:hypothetical protein
LIRPSDSDWIGGYAEERTAVVPEDIRHPACPAIEDHAHFVRGGLGFAVFGVFESRQQSIDRQRLDAVAKAMSHSSASQA